MGEPSSPSSNEKLVAELKNHKRTDGDECNANFDDHESTAKKKSRTGSENGASSEHKEQLKVLGPVVIQAEAAEDKGSRHTMEDAWVVLLPDDANLNSPPGLLRCAHFAIYDGHGGRLAAEYAQKHLHSNVLSAGLPRELLNVKAAKKAILEGFRSTDESLLHESAAGGWHDGATAVCVWLLGQTVFVANIGDAKAVVARLSTSEGLQNSSGGVNLLKAIVLTREHKAIYPQERARIQKAGGSVSSNGRVQGRLEVSRAFGDRQFKKVFGPSDAVEFVDKLLKEGLPVGAVSRQLVREAVRERRCKDNCTAIVIVFRSKETIS